MFDPVEGLTYAVIAARYNGKWILVRHNDRMTWEIPGGHIELDESPDEAAKRELMEETGAVDFTLKCVATYSVKKNGKTGFGRLFYSDVSQLGNLPEGSEIREIRLVTSLPENLTYPEIQPFLLEEVKGFLELR